MENSKSSSDFKSLPQMEEFDEIKRRLSRTLYEEVAQSPLAKRILHNKEESVALSSDLSAMKLNSTKSDSTVEMTKKVSAQMDYTTDQKENIK